MNKKPKSVLQEFIDSESASGILLMISAILALIVANSPLSEYYFRVLDSHITFGLPFVLIDKPLLLWINDGLMAVFFLLVGMEIKRELVHGELSNFKSAMLPIISAVGGAIVPAVIYLSLNMGTEYEPGWGIPMATDIAFAVGVLTLLGSRVPLWAKIFLTALAVVDDLLAVLVIAIFYTAEISSTALLIAAAAIAVLVFLNWRGVNSLALYIIIGVILWAAVLKSGVHATVAGVLLGFLIPVKRIMNESDLLKDAEKGISLLKKSAGNNSDGHKGEKESALNYLSDVVRNFESPLHRLEHKLHGWVAFGIMPIFAFANSGLVLSPEVIGGAMSSTGTWGIILGLFFGKQIGIFLPAFLIIKFTDSSIKPTKTNLMTFYGLAILGGIGFTMSLFIAGLAFPNSANLENAKIGIIIVSIIAGVMGYLLLKSIKKTDV